MLANALLNNPPAGDAKKSFEAALAEYAELRAPLSKAIARRSYWLLVLTSGDRWWSGWLRDFVVPRVPMSRDMRA